MVCSKLDTDFYTILAELSAKKSYYDEKIAVNIFYAEPRRSNPFGLQHKGYNNVVSGSENKYQTYQGKENQEELGLNWHDFGARNYDAALGRWFNIDPLSEKFYDVSTYNAMMNNPIGYIDPDGREARWKPDAVGNLTAEAGDSAGSLAKYLGVSQAEAEKIMAEQGYGVKEVDGKRVSQINEGDKLNIDNNATRAIARSNGITTKEALENGNAGIDPANDNYMCAQCAQMAVNGDEINPENARQYSQFMSWDAEELGFSPVDSFDGIPVNGGIATIGSDHTVSSYGQSRDGTVYVLSKDGHSYKPQVYTLEQTINLFNQVQGTNYTVKDVRYYKKNK